MRRLFCLFLCLCLCCCAVLCAAPACAEGTAAAVRVLLRRLNLTDRVDIALEGQYQGLYSGGTIGLKQGTHLTVQVREGQLYLFVDALSLRLGREFRLCRLQSGGEHSGLRISQGGGLYPGDLRLSVSDGLLQAVCTLSVEDYLIGVLPWEMSEDFPIEALKAQAICARTYALSHVDSSREWDVVDTTNDQVFKGVDNWTGSCARAVRDTAGMVGVYKGKLATCYYSASNGGQTELVENVWNLPGDWGYYKMVDDVYDLENPESMVRRVRLNKDGSGFPQAFALLLLGAMHQQLQRNGYSTEPDDFRLDSLSLVQLGGAAHPAPSRLATQLTLRFNWSGKRFGNEDDLYLFSTPGPEQQQSLSGWVGGGEATLTLGIFPEVLRALNLSIGGLDNELLTVREEDEAFVLEARRFGHGVGMSQRGAQWMAAHYGYSCEQILAFYYPGMTLSQLGTVSAPLPTAEALLFDTPGPMASPTPRPTLMPVSGPLPEGAWLASVEGVAEDSSLNLRAEPLSSAPILMRLYPHQRLMVLETCEDTAWVHVKTDAAEGYVMVRFLQRVTQ